MMHGSWSRRWPLLAGLRRALARLLALVVMASCSDRESARPAGDTAERLDWRAAPGDTSTLRVGLDSVASLRVPDVEPESGIFGYLPVLVFADGRLGVTGRTGLRVYSPDGHEQVLGRMGGGPGEFRNLVMAGIWPGDSIWAFDGAGLRLTVFAPSGALMRTASLAGILGPRAYVIGRMRDGRFLALDWAFPAPTHDAPGSRSLDSSRLLLADTLGASSLGWFRLREWWVGRADNRLKMAVPFGPEGVFAVGDSTFVYGWGATDSVRVFGIDAQVHRSFVVPGPPRRVTAADRRRQIAERKAQRADDFRAAALDLLEAMPWPESFPVFDRVLTDETLLLVRAGRPNTESEPWYVFDMARGPLLGTLQVPPRCSLMAFRMARLAMLCEEADADVMMMYGFRLARTTR